MSHTILDTFEAVSDDEQNFKLIVWQEELDAGTLADPNGKMKGLKFISTSLGHKVNRIDSETFEIVELDLIVRKKDA